MFNGIISFVADESGQTAQEYALIAAILAVVIPTAISLIVDDLIAAVRAAITELQRGEHTFR